MREHDYWAVPPGRPSRARWSVIVAVGAVVIALAAGSYLIVTRTESSPPSDVGTSGLRDGSPVSGPRLAKGDIIDVLPKDGIPAIDEPRFETVEAVDWLADKEPVIVIELNGDARAYPLQIMTWHEIVNDEVGGTPLAVTFCPLCNTAVAYERPEIDGEVTTFGTSGKLIHSNLLMYDRATDSLWPQVTGDALSGRLVGRQLIRYPARIVSWEEFKTTFPDGKVLSRDTGHDRNYGENPYPGYDDVDNPPFLFRGEVDGRLAAVERVLGIEIGGDAIAFPYFRFKQQAVGGLAVADATVGSHQVVAFWKVGTTSALDDAEIASSRDVGAAAAYSRIVDEKVLTFAAHGGEIIDLQTKSTWNLLGRAIDGPLKGRSLEPLDALDSFWFDWAAFHPDTEIWHGS
jgi:uncharacterized protein DUF3179